MKMQNEIKTEVIETKYEYVQVYQELHLVGNILMKYYENGWEPHLFSTVCKHTGTIYATYVLKRKIKNK